MEAKHSFKTTAWAVAGLLLVVLTAGVYVGMHAANGRRAAAGEALGKPIETSEVKDAHGHAASAHVQGEAEAEHSDEVTLTPQAIQQNQIKIETACKQVLTETFVVPGRVSYNTEAMAHVGTPVEGRVVEIKVRLGDVVRTGDELFVVDSPALGEAQSDFLQKRTQAQVAQSSMELAQTASERARRLLDGKGISLGELQKREGECKTAQGAVLAAQAALTAAENKLHLWGMGQSEVEQLVASGEIRPRYIVRAPIGGSAVEREATLGEIVGPDRETLLVLADLTTLWILADVPESLLHQVAVGSRADATVDAIPARSFEGRATYIAPALDKATRTAQVRVEVADGHTALKPGMFAHVQLTLANPQERKAEAVLAVPEAAIQVVEGGPAVFVEVQGEANTFAKQAVVVGPAVGRMAPVLSGLEEGKCFVSEGAFILKAELVKGIMEGKTCSGH